MMIMPDTNGFMKGGVFHLRKTYRYGDSGDMEEFEGIVRDEELSVTVEYHDDHVDVIYRPDW